MPRNTRGSATAGFAAIAIGTLLFSGCASDSTSDSHDDATAGGGNYPLTVHNSFGDVTIERKPERVATLGYADLALASSMGSEIVLAPESFSSVSGGDTEKSLPYIDSLPAETEWLNPMSIDVEQVAAAEPDVILATAAFSLDENIYSQLNDIAPVVSYEEGLYQASSEASAQRIGEVLGEEEMAEQLITDANDAVAQVKQDLPNLDGGTFLYGQARDDVAVMLVDKENVTARFMLGLGMEALPAVAELGGKGSVPGAVDISLEQADLFNDAGVMFMTYQSDAAKTAFESNPIIAEQPIMDDRYVPVGLEAATALQDPNVVSVPWLLDEIRPGLEKVPEN